LGSNPDPQQFVLTGFSDHSEVGTSLKTLPLALFFSPWLAGFGVSLLIHILIHKMRPQNKGYLIS
jgi:hypothetical protein